MRVNVKQFLEESGVTEEFYPGKRIVHKMRQTGEYKSHCVILDWRNPDKIRMEVKAGLSGRDLEPETLKYYPVCFQSPTYVDVEVINDNAKGKKGKEDEDEGSAQGSSGKSSGGGKQPKKSKLADVANAFSEAMEGKIPELGKVVEMVVLGKEIAKEAYGQVLQTLSNQIKHMKISATDILAKASDLVTRYQPPSFMEPVGDEQAEYKYDREKNADIGLKHSLG